MDDVILFPNGDRDFISHITDSLKMLFSLSGLQPSMAKSRCFLNNYSEEVCSRFYETRGIQQGSLPVMFLGVPLISSKLCVNDCMPLG